MDENEENLKRIGFWNKPIPIYGVVIMFLIAAVFLLIVSKLGNGSEATNYITFAASVASLILATIAKNPYPSAIIKGIDNVVLAGQWLNRPGGLPGAGIQGKFSIQRILKKEK